MAVNVAVQHGWNYRVLETLRKSFLLHCNILEFFF